MRRIPNFKLELWRRRLSGGVSYPSGKPQNRRWDAGATRPSLTNEGNGNKVGASKPGTFPIADRGK
jgi:hypothetical protein